MSQKLDLKQKAISLRTRGKTYSEILRVIPVAKSTLSLWFHDVGLAQSQKQRITQIGLVRKFWSKELGVPLELLSKVYFKKNKLKTNRRNMGLLYNGLIRVKIPKSSALVRRIEGWTRGIDTYCRIV